MSQQVPKSKGQKRYEKFEVEIPRIHLQAVGIDVGDEVWVTAENAYGTLQLILNTDGHGHQKKVREPLSGEKHGVLTIPKKLVRAFNITKENDLSFDPQVNKLYINIDGVTHRAEGLKVTAQQTVTTSKWADGRIVLPLPNDLTDRVSIVHDSVWFWMELVGKWLIVYRWGVREEDVPDHAIERALYRDEKLTHTRHTLFPTSIARIFDISVTDFDVALLQDGTFVARVP